MRVRTTVRHWTIPSRSRTGEQPRVQTEEAVARVTQMRISPEEREGGALAYTKTEYTVEKANARTTRSAATHAPTGSQSGPERATAGGGRTATTSRAAEVISSGMSVSADGLLARMKPENSIASTIPWNTTRRQDGESSASEATQVWTSCSETRQAR